MQRANGERLFTYYIQNLQSTCFIQNHIRLPYIVFTSMWIPIRLKSVWIIWFPQRNQHINKIDKITTFNILASSISFLARWIIELFNHIHKMCRHTKLHFIGNCVLCPLYILICRHSRKVFSIHFRRLSAVCYIRIKE